MPALSSASRMRLANHWGWLPGSMPLPIFIGRAANRIRKSAARGQGLVRIWWSWRISSITTFTTSQTRTRTRRRNDMYRQHFGLRHPPLGKELTDLWDDVALAQLAERFNWLLQSPGIGLITGEPGV